MRAVLLVFVAPFCLLANAAMASGTPQPQTPVVTFDQTVAAYERGDHELARRRFSQLARLGFAEPQFNYGVMLFRGEGGSADQEAGKAWLALAARQGYEPAAEAVIALGYPDADAIRALSEPVLDYHPLALFERHDPANVSDVTPGETVGVRPDFDLEPIKRQRPRYPDEAFYSRVQGWVRLGGWVHPDGSVRGVVAIQSSLPEVFDKTSIDAFRQWQFNPSEIPARERPLFVTQTFDYKMRSIARSEMPPGHPIARRHRQWLQEGEQDDISLLRAALVERSYPLRRRVPDEDYRELLFRLAMQNVPLASAQLAGFCGADRECRHFWRQRAAFVGHPISLFNLACGTRVEPELGAHMMAFAAELGMPAAVLHRLHAVANGELELDPAKVQELVDSLPEYLREEEQPLFSQVD